MWESHKSGSVRGIETLLITKLKTKKESHIMSTRQKEEESRLISPEDIEGKIFMIKGKKVMLDRDLAV